jgi:CBS domain containing-hemolysin-like protein
MQSRVNVTAVDTNDSYKKVMELVINSGYSRIPVYEETFDNVKGVLYIKDLLPFLDADNKKDWYKLIRPPFFVPENKRINDLLQEFREKKIHLAIVVDEYGGTSGIITLEDIIEEIVGEISDEFDIEESHFNYKKISPKRFIFEAKTSLIDMCKILNVDDVIFDEVRGESDSLGGLILELEGKIPEKGTVVSYDIFTFEVTDVTSRMIREVEVKINNRN